MWDAYHDVSVGPEERQKLLPNAFTYNIIIKSLCDLHQVKRADSLLHELLALEQQHELHLKPNSDTFALVISAWATYEARSKDRAGAGVENAFQLLKNIVQREENGDIESSTTSELYNNVLKAAAESPLTTIRVFDIAVKTFNLMDTSRHTPTNVSYKYLLQAGIKVLNSFDDEAKRSNFVKRVVKRCCDSGQLCRGVVHAASGFEEVIRDIIDWPPPRSCSRNLTNPQLIPTRSDFANVKETHVA